MTAPGVQRINARSQSTPLVRRGVAAAAKGGAGAAKSLTGCVSRTLAGTWTTFAGARHILQRSDLLLGSQIMSRFWSPVVQTLSPYVPGEQPKQGGFVKLNT